MTFDGTSVSAAEISRMADAAPHRQQDGRDLWLGAGAALMHQRRDSLPEDGLPAQPLVVAGLVLVADVRIDNRQELEPFLCRRGYLVDAGPVSDAEVVLAAYRCWGDAAPERLIGDFAFVVWDDRQRRLFAARDPMGMRPLYYREEPRRRALLASEVKQLLAASRVPREVCEAALAATLAGPHQPPEWTAYEGISQVAPGAAVVLTAGGRRSWTTWAPKAEDRFASTDEAAAQEAFRGVFAEAVAARLRSAGPVGVFLSGGLDSGSVASMAGLLRERREPGAVPELRSYSWAFDELPDSDERSVSDHVVRRYGLVGTAFPADDGWPLAGYPDHAPDEDDPYSWVYQALVERTLDQCRSDGVRTVLTGDRGDELLGDWVYDEVGMVLAGRVGAAVNDLRSVAASSSLPAWTALRRQVVRPLVTTRVPALARLHRGRSDRPWPPWVPDDFARRVSLADVLADARRPSSFAGAARTARHDRVFLAQSARIAVLRERTRARRGMTFADPYSDRRLVELVLSMPQWLVQRRDEPKRLLRQAMTGVMPEQARRTAAKTVPYGLFDRGFCDRARPVVDRLLTGSVAAEHGWLDERAARAVHEEYVRTGDTPWDFWWPLTVEMWLRRWWT